MDAFDRIAARTPQGTKRFVSKMLDIADRIHEILEAKGMSQKDLAKALGKSESEISKWLSGTHNLELKTITKIEEALGEDILAVVKPRKAPHLEFPVQEVSLLPSLSTWGRMDFNPHVEEMAWPAMTKLVLNEFTERQPLVKSMVVCRFSTEDVTFGLGIVPKSSVGHLQERLKTMFSAMRDQSQSVGMPDDELTLIEFGK